MKKTISVLLLLTMLVSLFAGLTLTAEAAQPTSAAAVNYRTSSGYVYNWGKRDTTATFLTTYAQNYYTGQYSYATLSAMSGNSGTGTAFVSSELGTAIHNMLAAKQSYTTSYDATRSLYQYTDCEENGNKISSFYSGNLIGPDWDSGGTWNREHIWPQSKSLGGSSNSDLMMIRPTAISENSSRGNNAFGTGSGYYDPNKLGYNLRGDVARITLQHLMRWGTSSSTFYGTGGVMESREILLQWMEADPVDTWEMGRNDAMQSILGVRNVFVDYPELAFKLLGASVPANYPTPSGGGAPAYTITATSNNNNYGTVTLNGSTITASPKTGYYAKDYTVTSGTATVTQNGNVFTIVPASDCTVRINFAAKTSVTVTLNNNGSTSTKTGYAGEAMTLTMPTAPTGYTAVGWVSSAVSDSTTEPATVYTTSFTPTGNCTLYALYSYVVSGGGGTGKWTLLEDASTLSSGMKVVIASKEKGFTAGNISSEVMSNVTSSFSSDGKTITSLGSNTVQLTVGGSSGAWTFADSQGKLLGATAVKKLAWDNGTTTWCVSVSDGAATIQNGTSSYGRFLYNATAPRFTTYTSAASASMLLPQLYYLDSNTGTTHYTTSTGPVCNHTYTSVVTQPTCTTGGYTTYTCSKCGDTYTGNEVAALGHNYGNFTHNANSNPSTHSKTCSRCSDKVTENCTFTNTTVGTTVTHTCSVCHYSYQSTLQTFTVSFRVPSGVSSVSSQAVAEGNPMTLPTAGSVEGYTFSGWVTSPISSEETTAPTILTGSYTPTGNMTLYALYTRTEAGSGTASALTKMVAGNTLADGDKLVIVAHDQDNVALYAETQSGSYVKKYTFDNKVASVLADSKNYLTVNAATGGYTLGDSEVGYLYTSGSNNLAMSTTNNTVWTLSDLGDGTFSLVAENGRKLSYRYELAGDNQLWRMGGSTGTSGQTVLDLYKVTSGASSTTYYTTNPTGEAPHVHAYDSTGVCSCGDKLISIDSAALKLDEDIDVIYNVTIPEGTVATMTFEMNGESTSVTGDGSQSFVFEGVTPQCMGDNISATLSITYGGKTYACTKANYSVKTYCTDMLAKSGTTTKLRKLLSDTLAYGAAAQTYMNYKTNALVTAGVTGTSYSSFTTLSGLAPTFTGTAVDSPCWIGARLDLSNNVAMVFRFASPNKTGLSVKVTYNNKTTTFSGTSITAVSGMSGVYEVKLTGIKATDFGQTVTAKFYKNSAQVGDALGYSVNTYICAKQNDSNTALKNLVRALYNYGASAAAYAS